MMTYYTGLNSSFPIPENHRGLGSCLVAWSLKEGCSGTVALFGPGKQQQNLVSQSREPIKSQYQILMAAGSYG